MTARPTGTVTFLFTDIEGSARLWEEHHDAMQIALARHDALMRDAIESNRGFVFKTVGDAFHAAFQTASDALAAAIDAQRALPARKGEAFASARSHSRDDEIKPNPISKDQDLANASPLQIRVRMALHSGNAEERDGDYFGPPLNRVARLLSAGHGEQILFSASTHELVRDRLPDGVTLRDLSEHRLRDLTRAEHVYQVVSPDLPSDFPPLKTLDTLPNNLPIQLTSFIGREKESAEIKRLLETARLVTLTGAGGCGKTRLALHVGADLLDIFSDGVWFIELAPLTDPSLVPQTVATTLGLREGTDQPIMTMLTNYLQDKNLLLILDNCEHLIDACIQLTTTLTRACPQLRILASSREALGIAGEVPLRVPSLSLPPKDFGNLQNFANLSQYESVRLFIERAQIGKSDFAVTNHNATALAQICHRLDGIPLALELAASRSKVLSVEEINARLDDRFRLLTGGSRAAMPRQQTLRAAIDWSYTLLSEPERVLLRRLSVFAGGWTLKAAEEVCSNQSAVNSDQSVKETDYRLLTIDILDLTSHLIDKSLVIAEEREGETRYRMLETIRQYAREKLLDSNEVERVREMHLEFFLALAEQAGPKLEGREVLPWLDKIEMELDNLRAAIDWAGERGKADIGLRVMNGTAWFWNWRDYWTEARERYLTLLSRPEASAKTAMRALALYNIAELSWLLGMLDLTRECADEALVLARELNDRKILGLAVFAQFRKQGLSDPVAGEKYLVESLEYFTQVGYKFGMVAARGNIGAMAMDQGKMQLAREYLEKAVALSREIGNELIAGWWLNVLADVNFQQGDYDHANSLNEEALAIGKKTDRKRVVARALCRSGQIAIMQGDYVMARTLGFESLEIYRKQGEKYAIALTLYLLSDSARLLGDLTAARTFADEGVRIGKETGNKLFESLGLERLSLLASSEGNYENASVLAEECLSIRRKSNIKFGISAAIRLLGDVSFMQGDYAQAHARYSESLTLSREMEIKPSLAVSTRMLGYLELHEGNVARAEELFRESFKFNTERKLKIGIIRGLPTFAALALARGQAERAAILLGATEALLEAMRVHLEDVDNAEYKRSIAAAKEKMDAASFAKAWSAGRALTLEQAIEYLLESASFSDASVQTPPPAYPAGLTEREVDVLRLIAQGLTDAQVAEKLVISTRTVNSHLRSIYGKIGVTTRTSAARFAVENKLI